jgi:hypothetical protein
MSDPTTNSPQRAPEYALHRHLDGVNDAGDITDEAKGMLMQDYEDAIIQVVPSASGNPAVSVLFWSGEAGKFIPEHTALDFAAAGAGVAWEARVKANGRRLFAYVTSGIGGADECHIYVSGFRRDQV